MNSSPNCSIKSMTFDKETRCYEFVFDTVVNSSETVLVPVLLVSKIHFGLAFIDTNDASVYLLAPGIHMQMERRGLAREYHPDELNRIGFVNKMCVDSIFQKIAS